MIARRSTLLGITWSPKLASQRFVIDLIAKQIINGPAAVTKNVGPGSGRRFLPRDYRDLLHVLKLKSHGVRRQSAWIVALWLRGHDYAPNLVRTSLRREVRIIVEAARRDIAPSGRWTDGFAVKYDRRVRQRPDANIFNEFVDLLEPIAALMIRPSQIPTDVLDPSRFGASLMACLGSDGVEISTAIHNAVERIGTGKADGDDTLATLQQLVNTILPGHVRALSSTPTSGRAPALDMDKIIANLRGMYDDGKGRAQLLDILETCTTATIVAARSRYQAMFCGHAPLNDLLSVGVTEDERRFNAGIFGGFRFQRQLARANPQFVPLLYAIVIADEWQSRAT